MLVSGTLALRSATSANASDTPRARPRSKLGNEAHLMHVAALYAGRDHRSQGTLVNQVVVSLVEQGVGQERGAALGGGAFSGGEELLAAVCEHDQGGTPVSGGATICAIEDEGLRQAAEHRHKDAAATSCSYPAVSLSVLRLLPMHQTHEEPALRPSWAPKHISWAARRAKDLQD